MRRPQQRRLQDRRTERQLWRRDTPAPVLHTPPVLGGLEPERDLTRCVRRSAGALDVATWVAVSAPAEAA